MQADSGTEQICYYNRNRKDMSFNSFLGVRKETASPCEINFSIVKVIDNANRCNNIYSEISDGLIDFKMTAFNEQFNELVKTTLSEGQQLQNQRDRDENIQVMGRSAKSQDFFLNNNATI